ncbi:MAG: DUF1282 family protein [Cyclobacteriaceae bacterium]|nr:DUF1282 family protein [Cyclobacteriaceae bacterium]
MTLIDRIKNIIVTPNVEWGIIDQESDTPASLLKSYLLPLGIAGAIATFIGSAMIGTTVLGVKVGGTVAFGLNQAVISLLALVLGFYITTYVVDMLAPTFKSEKDINKTAQLVAYSNTPALLGALLAIIPAISWIGALFGLYGFYLLFLGLPVLKKTPDQQRMPYIIVTIIVLLVVYFVIAMILGAILAPIFGISSVSQYGF